MLSALLRFLNPRVSLAMTLMLVASYAYADIENVTHGTYVTTTGGKRGTLVVVAADTTTKLTQSTGAEPAISATILSTPALPVYVLQSGQISGTVGIASTPATPVNVLQSGQISGTVGIASTPAAPVHVLQSGQVSGTVGIASTPAAPVYVLQSGQVSGTVTATIDNAIGNPVHVNISGQVSGTVGIASTPAAPVYVLQSGQVSGTVTATIDNAIGNPVHVNVSGQISGTVGISSLPGSPVYVLQSGQVSGTVGIASTPAAPVYVLQSGQISGTVQITGSLPAGTNNIGDMDVLTMPIPDFDINMAGLPANFSGTLYVGAAGAIIGRGLHVNSVGNVSDMTATQFMGGAHGAAVTKIVPAGANWFAVRVDCGALSSTSCGVFNYAAGNVEEGTGIPVCVENCEIKRENLNLEADLTLYFGACAAGGSVPFSLDYGTGN